MTFTPNSTGAPELHPGGVCGPATGELDLGPSVALNAREAA